MCRHSLPRFNFPVSRLLHSVGESIAAHPTPAMAVIVLSLCVAIFFAVRRRLHWPAMASWHKPAAYAARSPSIRAQSWASHL